MEFKGATKDEIIRELERRSNDSVKVFNPTLEEFRFKYNNYEWHVPSKAVDEGFGMGCMIAPRYIASHYIKKMCDFLINRESEKMVSSAKKKYSGNDWAREEERIALRTNNPLLIEKYARILWKGKVRDYGLDRPTVEEQTEQHNDKPIHLNILDKLEEESLRIVPVEKPVENYLTELSEPMNTNDTQG